MYNREPARRRRFGGRRYGLVRGTWIVFQDAPLAATTRTAVTLAAGAATGPLLVLATERFVATALDVAGGDLPPAAIAAPVIALAALFAVQIVESVVRALADARIEAGLRRGFRADLTGKRARLEHHYIERARTWDLLRRVAAGPEMQARPAPEGGPVKQAFDDGVGLAALAVRVIGLAAVLARLGWWIVPVAIAITVPFVLLGVHSGRRHYELERRLSGRRRRAEYLSEEVLQGREAAPERGLFDFGDYVNTRWRDAYDDTRRLYFRWIVRLWVRYKGGAAPGDRRGHRRHAGAASAPAGGCDRRRLLRRGGHGAPAGRTRRRSGAGADHLQAFPAPGVLRRSDGVLDDVGDAAFAYEACARAAIQVDRVRWSELRLSRHQTAGPQGDQLRAGGRPALRADGRQRVRKIDHRQADARPLPPRRRPDPIDGASISEWPQDALNGLFGVVFQDFARYSLTVRDNVEVSAAGRLDDAAMRASLARAGLGDGFVGRLPRGYDTPLGKVLRGGVDVSGGEWQRLAMARSLAGDAPVRILDEPTAALDPLAESELYRSYSRAATGLTTLFISHRLGSTKIAGPDPGRRRGSDRRVRHSRGADAAGRSVCADVHGAEALV